MFHTYLEDAPGNTTHCFSPGQDRQGRREHGNENHHGHPGHEKHHGRSAAESILGVGIGEEPCQLADERRVGQTGLPRRRNELFPRSLIKNSKAVRKLRLAVERGDLGPARQLG